MTKHGLAHFEASLDDEKGIAVKLDGRDITSEISSAAIRLVAGEVVTVELTLVAPNISLDVPGYVKFPEWVEDFINLQRDRDNKSTTRDSA